MTAIRRATRADVPRLAAIQRAVSLGDRHAEDASRHGFLVTGFTEADYERLVERADHVYVALDGGRVEAFVLAYSSELIDDDDPVSVTIRDRLDRPFLYVKQIAVDPASSGRGLAGRLYEHLASAAPDRPRAAAIVLDPPNDRSIAFHRRHGFLPMFELAAPDGRRRGIWVDRASDPGPNA